MWLDKMIQPQSDPWILRWDLTLTNFLDRDVPPTFLYYNPWAQKKSVTILGATHIRDLSQNRILYANQGRIELALDPEDARVVEAIR